MKTLVSSFFMALTLASVAPAQTALQVTPETVEVGEPFVLALDLSNPIALDPGQPELDESWVLLSDSSEPTETGMRFSWSLVSLEAGERVLAFVPGADCEVAPESIRLRVVSLLKEDEVEPRPVHGLPADFGAVTSQASTRPAWQWALGGVLAGLLLALAGRLIWHRWRRAPAPEPVLGCLERFDSLGTENLDPVARHHAWAQLLREAVDTRIQKQRAAWTEEEWLGSLGAEAGLSKELKQSITTVLGACSRVRFGGEVPSSFALEERQAEVRRLLESLGQTGLALPSSSGRAA